MLNGKKKVQLGPVVNGRTTVPVVDCVPNSWNMNVMATDDFRKLKRWVKKSKTESGRLALPIVIRTHPKQPGKWEIIDGFHRWKAVSELNWIDVDCWIYECDDKSAMLLTDSLNYLRGEPDGQKYADYLKELTENGATLDEIAELTHKSSEELQEVIDQYDIKIEEIEGSTTEEDSQEKEEKDTEFVEMKFMVPIDASEVVEAELARIGSVLTGKNLRGRALEFMAVQSAQTPMDDITSKDPGKQAVKQKLKFAMVKKRRANAT